MLEGGADVRWVQAMLGHRSLVSTQVYTQVEITRLAEIHAATHPGASNIPRSQRRRPPGSSCCCFKNQISLENRQHADGPVDAPAPDDHGQHAQRITIVSTVQRRRVPGATPGATGALREFQKPGRRSMPRHGCRRRR